MDVGGVDDDDDDVVVVAADSSLEMVIGRRLDTMIKSPNRT